MNVTHHRITGDNARGAWALSSIEVPKGGSKFIFLDAIPGIHRQPSSREQALHMISEADFDQACRNAAAAHQHATSERKSRRRVRSRSAADKDGWSCHGGARVDAFWPRFQDIGVVVAGIRSAVLLDSRRAPRDSPPLVDVLRALQDGASPCTCDGRGRGTNMPSCNSAVVASLGLMRLDGSTLLVNRQMLQSRLAEILSLTTSSGSVSTNDDRTGSNQPDETGVTYVERRADLLAGQDDTVAFTAATRPVTTRSSLLTTLRSRQGGGSAPKTRDFALLDVRRSLVAPTLRTELLASRLCATLRSIFGDEVSRIKPQANGCRPFSSPCADSGKPSERWEMSKSKALRKKGERWLREWTRKELTVEVGDELDAALGDVGLPGLVGWLLEYPVIYCCRPFPVETAGRIDALASSYVDPGNCLAMAKLTVHSLNVEIGKGVSLGSHSTSLGFSSSCEICSFSVPEVVHTGFECDDGFDAKVDEDRGRLVSAYLSRLVKAFVARFESRIARYACCCCQGQQQFIGRLSVRKRTETLDRLAL